VERGKQTLKKTKKKEGRKRRCESGKNDDCVLGACMLASVVELGIRKQDELKKVWQASKTGTGIGKKVVGVKDQKVTCGGRGHSGGISREPQELK